MTMPFSLPFPMPGDDALLTRVLARPGGLGAAPATDQAYLGRAVVGLDLLGLVGHAEALDPAEAGQLYELWLSAHGGEMPACAAWFNLGVARMRRADPSGAVDAYRAALRLKPDMAEAAINLGTALEASGQTEAALGAWRAVLPPSALRQVLHNQLGRVLETQGKLGPAAEELRASLLIAPHQPDVQQHLVHLRQRMTTEQIAVIAAAAVANLRTAQVGALTPDQVTTLTTAQIGSLSTDQMAGLTTAQTTAQMAAQIAAQIAALTITQITALETRDIVALSGSQTSAFTTAQIGVMTNDQISALFL